MIIKNDTLDVINDSISGYPPETGGIIGSDLNGVINKVIMDIPLSPAERLCSYSPNIDFLNGSIELWRQEGIEFKGVFHTHFMNVETLSRADERYICSIMDAMPDEINYLFFPVFVLPDRKLVCYKATQEGGNTKILQEKVKILF